MSLTIKLSLELRNFLFSQMSPGITGYQELKNAELIRSYVDRSPLEYAVECDADVAHGLRHFAVTHCPEAVREIDFALRLARSKEVQPRPYGWFWKSS
jgi:hypothetical protein